MCCTRLAGNTGCKDYAKNSPSGHHRTTLLGCMFATKACIDNWKKLVKQQYLLHTSLQYGELWSTSDWDPLADLGYPSNFQRVSRVVFITAVTSLTRGQPNFARRLVVSWAGTLYIHFWGLLPPDGILSGAKFTLRPSLAFSYIGSVTALHSSSGRQPNWGVVHEWNYGTLQRAPSILAGRPSRWASAHILVN